LIGELENLIPDLKRELKEYALKTLASSEDEEALLKRALEKAYIWLRAKLRPCGISQIDWQDDIVRQALFKRALYELYSYAENEEVARDKAQDAVELLRGYFGSCVEGGETTARERLGAPVVGFVPGQKDWRGFQENG